MVFLNIVFQEMFLTTKLELSKNLVAVLLVLALVLAGIGVGIAINNYSSVQGQYTEVPTSVAVEPVGGKVFVEVIPPKEDGEENG